MKESILFDKINACLYGGAIGDAMGAPAEWHYPDEIRERYGYITDFVENWDGSTDIFLPAHLSDTTLPQLTHI